LQTRRRASRQKLTEPPPPIWRRQVMLLPTRMSGTEKREKMALMEAAISSAMNHPNILQASGWGARFRGVGFGMRALGAEN
jgi:hypothetical protein